MDRLDQEIQNMRSFVESACWDMAADQVPEEKHYSVERECKTDELYNEEEMIADLLGDRIGDAITSSTGYRYGTIPDSLWNDVCRKVADMFKHLPGLYDKLAR